FEAAEDIVQVVPAADASIVGRLLELCHHRISPARSGAAILYLLTDQEAPGHRRDGGIGLAGLRLSVLNGDEEPLLVHQARYRDGAMVVARDGTLLAVNVILRPTRASELAATAMK